MGDNIKSKMTFKEYFKQLYMLESLKDSSLNLDLLNETKTMRADPHEFITACFMANNGIDEIFKTTITQKNLKEFLKESLKLIKIGIEKDGIKAALSETDLDYINDLMTSLNNENSNIDVILDDLNLKSFIDKLPKAVSAAQAIFDNLKNEKIDNVYLTGAGLSGELADFELSNDTIKNYNSSDIVLQQGQNYIGISLKQKDTPRSADPTLTNFSINNILSSISDSYLKDIFDKTTNTFYTNILNSQEFYDEILKDIPDEDFKNDVINTIKPDVKNWRERINIILNDKIQTENEQYLKIIKDKTRNYINNLLGDFSPNNETNLFKIFSDNLKESSSATELAEKLLNLIFRRDLKQLVKDLNTENVENDKSFLFALVTGIGKTNIKNKTITFIIGDGNYYDINITENVIENLIKTVSNDNNGNNNITLVISKRKSNAAKIWLTLKIGNINICDIEIRYKGSFASYPQFQTTLTKEFKSLLDEANQQAKKK